MFVDSETIRAKKIFGTFKKYTYFCNGIPSYVYCTKPTDVLTLIGIWNRRGYNGLYVYTVNDLEGENIALADIPFDQDYHVKVYCDEGGLKYIK